MEQETESEATDQPELDDAIHRSEEERGGQDEHREETRRQPAVEGTADVIAWHGGGKRTALAVPGEGRIFDFRFSIFD
jgi:hypothetical protein